MKDKLMELLNEMVQERNQTNTEIENRILDKTIKGLQVIRECLEYGEEMKKYFIKIKAPYIGIGKNLRGTTYFAFNGNVFEIQCNNWFDWDHYYNSTFDKYSNETLAKQEKFKSLQSAARVIIDTNFTLEEFQKIINETLAERITRYHQQTEELKKNLSK